MIRKNRTTIIFFGLLLIAFFILSYEFTFAFTFFKDAPVNHEETFKQTLPEPVTETQIAQLPLSAIGHAPEPATFILFLGGITGMMVRFVRKSFTKFKRYMDISLSTLGVLVTAPVMIFVAILIKLTSKGPIIYRQKRVGENGRIFRIYKLRTMRIDAEKGTGAVWAKKNDPRVTPFGKLLRKTSLDELPQFLNVLLGQMSLVGPRPERPEFVAELTKQIPFYGQRHVVPPGLTGWAQVRYAYGASVEDAMEKLQYDLFYIKNRSLALNLYILFETLKTVVVRSGS